MKFLHYSLLPFIFVFSTVLYAQNTDLNIQKTGPNSVNSCQRMSYTIIIGNNGPNAVTNATFNDNLPTGVTNVAYSGCTATGGAVCPATVNLSSSNFSGTIPFLPVGGRVVMVIALNAPSTATAGVSFSNTATVAVPAGYTETNPSTNSSTWNVTLRNNTDIEVIKTQTPSGSLGSCSSFPQSINYIVKWINHGPACSNNITLGDRIRFNNINISGAGNADFTYPWTVNGLAWSTSSGTSIPTGTFGSLSGNTTISSSSSTTLSSLSTTVATWEVGDTVTLVYTLTIQAPTITDCGRTVSFNINNSSDYTIPAGNSLIDTFPSNNSASVNNTVTCVAPACPTTDIQVIKTRTPTTALGCNFPTTLSYTIRWINHGTSAADGVSITDRLSFADANYNSQGNASYSYPWSVNGMIWTSSPGTTTPTTSFSPMSGNTTPSNGNTVTLGNLSSVINTWQVGDTITLTYNLIIQPPVITGCGRSVTFDVRNSATFTIPNSMNLTDTVSNNNTSTVNNQVTCTAPPCTRTDIQVIKTRTPTTDLGCNFPATIDYTVLWINHGPAAADGISITDRLSITNINYNGAGNATFAYPWAISNVAWTSSAGTTTPATTFNQLSGTFTPSSGGGSSTLTTNSPTIVTWEANDTITLTYTVTIQQPTITGCGRQVDFDVRNVANFTIPAGFNLTDTISSNNSVTVLNGIDCSAPACPTTDIEVIKTRNLTIPIDCEFPATIDYTVLWINHGPSSANGSSLGDRVSFFNTVFGGAGNAAFAYPWAISNLTWYASPGTTKPTQNFSPMSGSSTPISGSTVSLTSLSPTITTWEAGDTIRLTYTMIVQQPALTGCGRNVGFDLRNIADYLLPFGTNTIDTDVNNNSVTVTNHISAGALDLSISVSPASPTVNYQDSISLSIVFQNASGGVTAGSAVWIDTLPTSFEINTATISCVATGGAVCGPITYDPVTRILSQTLTGFPSGGQVAVTFRGQAVSPYSQTVFSRVYAFQECIDCQPNTNFSQTTYQLIGPCGLITAGYDGATTICSADVTTIDLYGLLLGEQLGGTWVRTLGTGGVFDSVAGTFNTAGATSSVFDYIVAGGGSCPNDTGLVVLTVKPTPVVTLSPANSTVCRGTTLNLVANGAIAYSWSTGATTLSIAVAPNATTTYSITGTDSGCSATATSTVTVIGPSLTIAPAGICGGNPAVLNATGATDYLWSTGETTASITVATTGTYTVTGSDASGCTVTASRTVTNGSTPSISISGTNTICSNATSTFTASGASSYIWSTGQSTAAIIVNTAGIYTVTGTNSAGCTGTRTRTLNVNTAPNASIVASSPNLSCLNPSVTLTASGGGTYLWSNAATTVIVNTNTAGAYSVTVTAANGCTALATVSLTQTTIPVSVTAANNSPVCTGGSVQFSATGGTSYAWSGPSGYSAVGYSPDKDNMTSALAGTYIVTATDSNGCTGTATTTVSVNTCPEICGNGMDDDGDGLIDAADSECPCGN